MKQGNGSPESPVLAAGAVIWKMEDEEPQFLLLQNKKHKTWGFPKGHLEIGETTPEGAYREIEEEIGLPVNHALISSNFADVALYETKPGIWKRTIHYLIKVDKNFQEQLSGEHSKAIWANLPQSLKLLSHNQLHRTIIRATQYIVSN